MNAKITPTLIAAIQAGVIQYPNIHDAVNENSENGYFTNKCTIDCEKRRVR